MRQLGLTIAAAALATGLAGCGKSPSNNQADQAQATSSQQSTTAASTQPAEPTEAQKKTLVAALPAPYNGGDLSNGESKFAVCKS
jgi:cytochrome c